MDLISEKTSVGYKEIVEMLRKLTEEATKLEAHQKKLSEHNHALGNLNRSFNQAQTRVERVAVSKCGSDLLKL